jgi:hypothetical protein
MRSHSEFVHVLAALDGRSGLGEELDNGGGVRTLKVGQGLRGGVGCACHDIRFNPNVLAREDGCGWSRLFALPLRDGGSAKSYIAAKLSSVEA